MRPEKDEAEDRKCEDEAKTYEAEATVLFIFYLSNLLFAW